MYALVSLFSMKIGLKRRIYWPRREAFAGSPILVSVQTAITLTEGDLSFLLPPERVASGPVTLEVPVIHQLHDHKSDHNAGSQQK